MDEYWFHIWKSFPISPWSAALYLVLSWWASRKIPHRFYRRIAWLASWVDAISVLGLIVLIGDIIWLFMCWFRWNDIYFLNQFSLFLLPLIRNIGMIIICLILMSRNWLREGYIHFSKEVVGLIGLNILYLFLYFYLAPGIEWTHWVYALENGYACWPYVWFIAYPMGRSITSLLYIKMWSPPNAS